MTNLRKYIRREDGSERELSPREYEAIDYYGEDIATAFPRMALRAKGTCLQLKAKYKTRDGISGIMNYPVIIPNAMQHVDGFNLLAFRDWGAVNDEKLCAAVTDVQEFHIENNEQSIGFIDAKEQN